MSGIGVSGGVYEIVMMMMVMMLLNFIPINGSS